jgi:hypothetical protein
LPYADAKAKIDELMAANPYAPPAELAWSAGASEQMVSGAGDSEFKAQYRGTGTPTFTHSGLLLPDHNGVYVEIAANAMPVHGARWENGTPYTDQSTNVPLTESPSLYAAPALTNLVTYSRDLSNAAWVKAGGATATYDQVGLTGEPNTASSCLGTGGSSTLEFIVGTSATVSQNVTAAFYVTKDVSDGQLRTFMLWNNTTERMWIDMNTETGAAVDSGGSTGTFEVIDDGTRWIVLLQYAPATTAANRIRVYPVRIGAVQIPVTIENAVIFEGKTIAEVKGAAPIVTEGSTVTSTLVDNDYDIGNHDNARGAYYSEEYRFDASSVNQNIISPNNGAAFGRIQRVGGINCSTEYINPSEAGGEINFQPISNVAQWQQLGTMYDSATNEISLSSKTPADGKQDSVKNTDYSYFRGAGPIGTPANPVRIGLIRNIQRWDLAYTDAKAKIDELMGDS